MQVLEFKKGEDVPRWLLIRSEDVTCIFGADCTVTKPKGITGKVHVKWDAADSETVVSIRNPKNEKINSPWQLYFTSSGKVKPKINVDHMLGDFLKSRRTLQTIQ